MKTVKTCLFGFALCVIVILASVCVIGRVSTFESKQKNGKYIREFQPKYEHRLAVIVPYRNVFGELQVFIPLMAEFLNKQGIEYEFYVIRQADNLRYGDLKKVVLKRK